MYDAGYCLESDSHNELKGKERTEQSNVFDLATTMQTAFTAVQGDVTSVLAVAIPIAVGIAGILFVARKAMGWFKSMAK